MDDVERVNRISKAAKSGQVSLEADARAPVVLDTAVSNAAAKILQDQAKLAMMPVVKYGSLTGVLRQVTVDTRNKHSVSKFQLIDRETEAVVECDFDPKRSRELQVTRRIVVYGEISREADGKPKRIRVEDFRPLSDNPPRLRDLHALRINITDGEDAVDYLDKMRGDVG